MKRIGLPILLVLHLCACKNTRQDIVDTNYADSLLTHYKNSPAITAHESNLSFWKNRMDSLPDDFVNGPEYAAALLFRFRLCGEIHDLLKADSLYTRSNVANQQKEPGIFRNLASLALLRHRFTEADSFFKRAFTIEVTSISNLFLDFDVSFEKGDMHHAKWLLGLLRKGNSYGYWFRRAKYEHYDGSLDSSIRYMIRAAEKSGNNKFLRQVALSNAADLNLHKGDLRSAYELYKESIAIDASDMHSISGIAWISLVHDKNDSLAERILNFVRVHQQNPDVLLKLEQLAELRGDSVQQKYYALLFEKMASDSCYGLMYSKYLIDLYTGILNEPSRAMAIAEKDILNRPTPQVYAWYAWSLYCNQQYGNAFDTYKNYVSGKPLEGLELYYMGKLMKGLNKEYNARQFFKAAYKNRYELSPGKIKELDTHL